MKFEFIYLMNMYHDQNGNTTVEYSSNGYNLIFIHTINTGVGGHCCYGLTDPVPSPYQLVQRAEKDCIDSERYITVLPIHSLTDRHSNSSHALCEYIIQ